MIALAPGVLFGWWRPAALVFMLLLRLVLSPLFLLSWLHRRYAAGSYGIASRIPS